MSQVAIESVFADIKTAAVIVAHPDDETLWVGGIILLNSPLSCFARSRGGWTILSLCRKSDPDRAPKFFRVIDQFGAKGFMTDLDDGSDQKPLKQTDIQKTILSALPEKSFDIILTHNPKGEYTRHLRHEETSLAVLSLWKQGELKAKRLLLFAYEDGGKKYLPRPQKDADIVVDLPKSIWQKKKDIIINSYGFSPNSFEAKAVSDTEAFWLIEKHQDIKKITDRS